MLIIKNISIIFISIFLESVPFILLGAFISAIIENYITDEQMAKLIPKNKVLGSIVGIILGFFLPACDCAVIPISKRLLKKKVPINAVISFMLASPIINPVVMLATYNAFYKVNPQIFWYRLVLGIVISLIVGIIVGIFYNDEDVVNEKQEECHSCSCNKENTKRNIKESFLNIIHHMAEDSFGVIKYLIIGALIASSVQVLMPKELLYIFKGSKVLSTILLMIFAYIVSLCSTSDSFVAKALLVSFHESAVMGYLLLGPMIDIKNTVVLLGNFKKKFVYFLITTIFICVFLASILVIGGVM